MPFNIKYQFWALNAGKYIFYTTHYWSVSLNTNIRCTHGGVCVRVNMEKRESMQWFNRSVLSMCSDACAAHTRAFEQCCWLFFFCTVIFDSSAKESLRATTKSIVCSFFSSRFVFFSSSEYHHKQHTLNVRSLVQLFVARFYVHKYTIHSDIFLYREYIYWRLVPKTDILYGMAS